MKLFELDLMEAQDYESMFNSVYAIASYLPTEDAKKYVIKSIKEDIQWAKQSLKKNDRVIWYLRIVKYRWLKQLESTSFQNLDSSQMQLLIQKLDKELKKLNKFQYLEKSKNVITNSFGIRIEHYLSLPVEKIRNYVWENQPVNEILNDFEKYEEEWKEASGARALEIFPGLYS